MYCGELPFDVLSYSSYIDLGKMKIVFSIVENNEYKLLKTKSKKLVNALRLSKVLLFMEFLKILGKNSKIYSDNDVLKKNC